MASSFDPVFAAECYIDGQLEEWERLRSESVCGDCEHCKRIFDKRWYPEAGKLAVCGRDGLDWDERDIRWTDEPCEDFAPRMGW